MLKTAELLTFSSILELKLSVWNACLIFALATTRFEQHKLHIPVLPEARHRQISTYVR